jgi:aminoglycoside phosphotransferase (APT) family kinase protein
VEHLLTGADVNPVVRVDDTVRRVPQARAAFVHELLGHLEASPFAGAPRFLGMDEQGREILTFVDGQVGGVDSDESLQGVARLVRELHDLTAGTPLAGSSEVVCHNDLSPKNTVYRDSLPVAFIDWDLAAPGARIHDVAQVCWQFLDLGPNVVDVTETGRRMRLIIDAYGLRKRQDVIETILWWQERCWRGIVAQAEAGDPAMRRLNDAGVPVQIRSAHLWVVNHRRALGASLR